MAEKELLTVKDKSSKKEKSLRVNFYELYKNCPIPPNEILNNLGLFINRRSLSKIIFMHKLYKKILDVHGIIIEFGVRWGQNLALFEAFRGMYEPYNYTRKILGFDTFEGFPSIHEKDGFDKAKVGYYSVSENYKDYLKKVLDYHEGESPISHIKKYELVKGDASITIKKYLEDNPETIIALAYFDLDLYEPTKNVLEAIKPYLTKGSIIGFDELTHPDFPGETLALKEVFELNQLRIHRSTSHSYPTYFVFE
ncbi:MAG: crotonobetainyl-CoA--carnitine CoA-transferase [Candidatus Hodarchaeota archaeon]